jgi:hypothetical protein
MAIASELPPATPMRIAPTPAARARSSTPATPFAGAVTTTREGASPKRAATASMANVRPDGRAEGAALRERGRESAIAHVVGALDRSRSRKFEEQPLEPGFSREIDRRRASRRSGR